MKNYITFPGLKIVTFTLLSFITSAHSIKEEANTRASQTLDTCSELKAKESKLAQTANSILSLQEMANLYQINLGGEKPEDKSEVQLKEPISHIVTLRELISVYGIKVF